MSLVEIKRRAGKEACGQNVYIFWVFCSYKHVNVNNAYFLPNSKTHKNCWKFVLYPAQKAFILLYWHTNKRRALCAYNISKMAEDRQEEVYTDENVKRLLLELQAHWVGNPVWTY